MKGIGSACICVVGKVTEFKQSKNGKPYRNFSCSVACDQDDPQGVSVIVFNETAQKLA